MKKVSINTTNGGTFKDIKVINNKQIDTICDAYDVLRIIESEKTIQYKNMIIVEGELDRKPYTACISIRNICSIIVMDY